MDYEKLFKEHGFDINKDKEKFYEITKSDLLDMKLWHVKKGGKVEIIKHCFPNEEWLTFKFKRTHWCHIKEERIKYTKFLVKKLYNNNSEKYYSLLRKDIKQNYGQSLDKYKEPAKKCMSLQHYLLEEAFPDVEWFPWKFDGGCLYYNEKTERRFIELFEEDNNIKEPEDWYKYNGDNITKSKGDWLTNKYGHIYNILISVRPELKTHLKIYKFTSPPNGWFDSLDNLINFWKDSLEECGGIDNVQLYEENNKGTFTFVRKINEKYESSSTIECICKFHSEYINKNVELYEFTHLWNKKDIKERFLLLEDILYLQKYVKYLEEKHSINNIDGWYDFDITNKISTLNKFIREKYNNNKYEFFKKIYPDKDWKKELFICLTNHTNERFQGSEYSLPIPFEPMYRITLKGVIFNKTSKEIKTLTPRPDGRVTVNLNGQLYLLYRVMAITFFPLIGNPKNYFVDHINSNLHDNTLSNLRWCRTCKENMNNPNTKKKLKDAQSKISNSTTNNTQAGGFLWKNPIIQEIETRKKTVEWKLFEDDYIVFSKGQNKIYSLKRNIYIKGDDSSGYRRVTLKHNKHYSEHRIVAELFIDNPHNKQIVDHKDTNKLNNDVDNLQWVTVKENMNNPNTKKKLKGNPNCGKKIQITYEDGEKEIIPSLKQCGDKLGKTKYNIKTHIENGDDIEINGKKAKLSYLHQIM